MRLNPARLRDRLTVEILTPGPLDPSTDVPLGPPTLRVVVGDEPCSDQDVRFARRGQGVIVNGVMGTPPVSLCYVAAFDLPALQPGESVCYRVNGRVRPLLRAGPPLDVGGQGQLAQLELGAPEDGL
jgi:hypothetical protein